MTGNGSIYTYIYLFRRSKQDNKKEINRNPSRMSTMRSSPPLYNINDYTFRETLSERHQQQTFNQALLETGYKHREFPNKGSTKYFSPIETKYYEYYEIFI